MSRAGFNDTSIKITQINNWFVDYFAPMEILYGDVALDLAKLHFDSTPDIDLSTTQKIDNFWSHFTRNSQNAIHQAVFEKNKWKLLAYIGMSMHAVQDFYSHSNWVEQHERIPFMPYRTDTWFNSTPIALTLNLKTGHYPNDGSADEHGLYTHGINHDGPGPSPTRSRFDEAYAFGYVASMEWIQVCNKWADEVDTSFWSVAQTIPLTPGLQADIDKDLEAVYRLSEWAGTGGHWKGPGSTDTAAFIDFAAGWVNSVTGFRSLIQNQKIHKLLTDGLTSETRYEDAPPVDGIFSMNDGTGVVVLRTTRVTALSNIDNGKADFFPRISIAGQGFTEAMQLDIDDVAPFWTTMRFVNTNQPPIPIKYTLWDEDGGLNGADDHADINPIKGKIDLDFTVDFWTHMLAGDVTGVHDFTPVSSSGEKGATDRSRVQFTVTTSLLDQVHTVAKKKLKLTITPTTVTIPVTYTMVMGQPVYNEKSKTLPVTITAVDAATNLPVQGYVYEDTGYSTAPFLGTSGSTFNFTFWSKGASHNQGFRVYAPGYDSEVANVWVDRIVQ